MSGIIKRIRKKEFKEVQEKGRTLRSNFLILKFAKNNLGFFRLSCVVSKKIEKKATRRNKIKRRLRESIRKAIKKMSIVPGYDFIFFARENIKQKKFEEIAREVEEILRKAIF